MANYHDKPKKISTSKNPRVNPAAWTGEEDYWPTPEGEAILRRLIAQINVTKRRDRWRREFPDERFLHPIDRPIKHRNEAANQMYFNVVFTVLLLLLNVEAKDQSRYRKWIEALWPSDSVPKKDALARFRKNFRPEPIRDEVLSELRASLRHAGCSLTTATELLRPRFRNLIAATLFTMISRR